MSDFGLTEDFLFAFRQEELVGGCLDALFYGMLSSLIIFLVYFHWNSRETKWNSSNALMSSILSLYFFRTASVAINWWLLWRAFIRNGDTSDDIVVSLMAQYPSLEYWVEVVPRLLNALGLTIADSIMIWRCWITCNRAWSSVITQAILTLGSFATGLTICGVWISPIDISDQVLNALNIANIALSVVSTVLSTFIITVRILQVSRMPGAPQSHRLNGIIEIVVESAALYAIAGLIYLYFMITGIDNQALRAAYIEVFFAYAVVLAPALIMLRVALGRARPDTAWSNNVSDLQFSSVPGVSARSSGTVFSILTSQRYLLRTISSQDNA